jgi:hypothetical protein
VEIKLVEAVKALLEALGSWKPWTFGLLASTFILFILKVAADFLSLRGVRDQVWPWLIFIAIASIAGLIVTRLSKLEARMKRKKEAKSLLARLRSLSIEEKVLLMTYMDRQTKTLYFEIENGLARGLEAHGILFRPSSISRAGDMVFAFNLQSWAWVELQGHPELLELPKGVDPRSVDIGEVDD